MTRHDTVTSIADTLAARPVLTAAGEAALAAEAGKSIEQVPGHYITVTGGGPFGRAWFECSCGIERRHASKHAANVAARAHYDQVKTKAATP